MNENTFFKLHCTDWKNGCIIVIKIVYKIGLASVVNRQLN